MARPIRLMGLVVLAVVVAGVVGSGTAWAQEGHPCAGTIGTVTVGVTPRQGVTFSWDFSVTPGVTKVEGGPALEAGHTASATLYFTLTIDRIYVKEGQTLTRMRSLEGLAVPLAFGGANTTGNVIYDAVGYPPASGATIESQGKAGLKRQLEKYFADNRYVAPDTLGKGAKLEFPGDPNEMPPDADLQAVANYVFRSTFDVRHEAGTPLAGEPGAGSLDGYPKTGKVDGVDKVVLPAQDGIGLTSRPWAY